MKDLVSIGLLAAILFMVWSGTRDESYTDGAPTQPTGDAVPPDVTQVILEKVLSSDSDLQPLETLFINHEGNGVYNARFMFINTKHFYGAQYDVQARVNDNASVDILSMTGAAKVDYSNAYKPDRYQSWSTVQASLDSQLKQALSQPVQVPPVESYKY